MINLKICNNHLVIILHKKFLAFSHDPGNEIWILLKIVKCNKNSLETNDASIECCDFSPCGKYFGVCYNKNLMIYNTVDWNVLYNSPGERKAHTLRFFPKSRIVLLADKSGYAGFYSFEADKLEKKDFGIGHNSMLTGALITEDEKFIITCDRDEKIRVSNYPNVYNIQKYCLGHRLFVSSIDFLPSDKRILVSSSGDGEIKFWNFMFGLELACYACNSLTEHNESLKPIITKIELIKQNNMSVVVVMEYKSQQVRILNVEGDLNKGLSVELSNILNLGFSLWDITLWDKHLLCLLPDKNKPLQCWTFCENNLIESQDNFSNIKQYLSDNWEFILNTSCKISDDIPILFKRDIDNLQEYEKRKKARLLKTGKTS